MLFRCLLALLVQVVPQERDIPPGQLYSEAVTLYRQGEIEQAIAKYEQLIKVAPDSVEARTNLGVALARLGRYPEAIPNYEAALAHDRTNAVARLNLALAWYKSFEFDKAARELNTVYAAHPDNLQALHLLADCYLRLGLDKQVIALLAPLDSAGSQDSAVWYLLGTALVRDGDIAQGQKIIDRILRDGDSAEANLLMGAAQLAAHENERALASVRKALDRNPMLPGAYTLYGRAQLELDYYEAAKASFRRALEADSTDFEANLNLGAMLRRSDDSESASGYLTRALKMRPGSLAARFQVGAVMVSLGKFDEALKQLEFVARESPEFLSVHSQLAVLYYRLGRKLDGERERAIVSKLEEKAQQR